MTDLTATPSIDLGAAVAAPAPEANANILAIKINNTDDGTGNPINLAIDRSQIPPELRLELLDKAIRDYVNNSVNQEHIKTNKANAAFDAYAKAVAADAMQTTVAKPEGEPAVGNYVETAKAARERLYKNEVRRMGEGTGKSKAPKDPLIAAITSVVVREVFEKNKATTQGYKWTTAVTEVGSDGLAYLKGKLEEKVLAAPEAEQAATRAKFDKFLDERYVKPAQMMVGTKTNKATEDTSLL